MKFSSTIRNLLMSSVVVVSATAMPAFAQVHLSIVIAPPAQVVEVAPALPPERVWVPGYWAWHGDRYIWVSGRSVMQRPGYLWVPDQWEQRGQSYYRNRGHWERDSHFKPAKVKKAKKPKHWEKDNRDRPGNREGRNGRSGKGRDD